MQVYAGAAVMQFDIVARKAFSATSGQIAFLFTAAHAAVLCAAFWGIFMSGRSRRRFLAGAALVGPGLLALMPLARSPGAFILLCSGSAMADAILVPFRNRLLQTNYDPARRGAIWGRIFGVGRLVHLAAALAAGMILDRFPGSHRFLFPATALAGLGGILLYSRIRLRGARAGSAAPLGPARRWWRDATDILRRSPRFVFFEVAFMVYGSGFMLLLPLHAILAHDVLGLSYAQAALLRQVVPHLLIALLSGAIGRLQDRTNPVRIAVYAFALLSVFPLLLWMSAREGSVVLAGLGFACFGAGLAFVHATWELGPTWFAADADSSAFMGIHFSAVGLRGAIFPPVGSLIYRTAGLGGAYAAASTLFAAAAVLMAWLMRRVEKPPAEAAITARRRAGPRSRGRSPDRS